MRPVHFDKAAVLAAFDAGEADEVAHGSASDLSSEEAALAVAGQAVRRAFLGWIVDARNLGIDHEIVAHVAGGILAGQADILARNYPCGCVPGRTLKSFHAHLDRYRADDPELIGKSSLVHPIVGGRA